MLDRPVDTRAEVVYLPCRPALEQVRVAAHHIAYVRKIARRLKIAGEDDGIALARLDLGDLLGEVRDGEGVASSWPLMVEGARTHDVEPVALPVLKSHEVLRNLAHRVRRQRSQRIRLADRQLVGIDEPI